MLIFKLLIRQTLQYVLFFAQKLAQIYVFILVRFFDFKVYLQMEPVRSGE